MKQEEITQITIAIVLFAFIISFQNIISAQFTDIPLKLIFAIIIILVAISSKKIAAHFLDADVEHEIWKFQQYGIKKQDHFKKPVPMGIILPIILSIFSLGLIKFSAMLTYEARALKHRAAKRFGEYSFTEMTDWHHALIGATSTLALLTLALVSYLSPLQNLETLAKLSVYYAFWNLLPISKLDGAQIFFGSRIIWSVLATIISLISFIAVTIQ